MWLKGGPELARSNALILGVATDNGRRVRPDRPHPGTHLVSPDRVAATPSGGLWARPLRGGTTRSVNGLPDSGESGCLDVVRLA